LMFVCLSVVRSVVLSVSLPQANSASYPQRDGK